MFSLDSICGGLENDLVRRGSGGAPELRRLGQHLIDRAAVDARPVQLPLIELLLREQHGLLLMVGDRGRDPAIDESLQAHQQKKSAMLCQSRLADRFFSQPRAE